MTAATRFLARYPIAVPIVLVAAVLLLSSTVTGDLVLGWRLLRVPAGRTPLGPSPFLDLRGFLSALDCLRQGIDATQSNPCDPLRRAFIYPAPWLSARVLGLGAGDTLWLGLALSAAFLAAAVGLFRSTDWRRAVVAALILASPPVLLALERGNLDIVMFPLIVLGLGAMHRRDGAGAEAPFSPLFVLAAVLGGFFKLYPLAALAALWRSRASVIAASLLALLAAAAIVAVYGSDNLAALFARVPNAYYYAYGYAALAADGGPLADMPFAATALRFALGLACGAGVLAGLRRSAAIGEAARALGPFERSAFNAGLAIYALTFMAGSNFYYRLIFLLLLYPALLRWTATSYRRLGWGGIAFIALFFWLNAGPGWLVGGATVLAWSLFITALAYFAGTVVAFWRPEPAAPSRIGRGGERRLQVRPSHPPDDLQ